MTTYNVTWNYDNQITKKGKDSTLIRDASSQREAIKLAKRRTSGTRKR